MASGTLVAANCTSRRMSAWLPRSRASPRVAWRLRPYPDMTSIGSTAQVRELQPLIELRHSLASAATPAALVARVAGARRRRGTPRRLGLLRLAPRLVVLPGRARQPNWPVVAAGIGSAFTGSIDPDDAPWCA